MSSGFDDGSELTRRRLARCVALVIVGGFVVLLARLGPPSKPPPKPAARTFAFESEPLIRVRIRTLEPGKSIRLRGAAPDDPSSTDAPRDLTLKNVDGSLTVGDAAAAPMPRVFRPSSAEALGIDDLKYRGEIVVLPEPGKKNLLLLNRLPIERYLEGVVLSEMSPKFPEEALRAQAVASRSYAAFRVLAMRSKPFDVTDTQASQVYRGERDRGRAMAARLVADTRGIVLSFEDRVLEAVFSSTCGGTTRAAEEAFGAKAPAPLRGVHCGRCEATEFATWTCRVKRAALGTKLALGGPVASIGDERRSSSGRLAGVLLRGPAASKTLNGAELRAALGEKALSAWFTRLAIEGDSLVAEGRGYGHGAGLCQVGARTMANAGDAWPAILAAYFPDAEVARLYPEES